MTYTLIILAILACYPAAPAPHPRASPQSQDLLIEWPSSEGKLWTLRARIDRPAPNRDRGYAVFLFGGGLTNDLDWTTPGRIEHEGNAIQLTISGEDCIDGRTLADALVAGGWTVIRYSAIREGDPLHAQSRGLAEAMNYPGTLELARFMWNELLKRAEFEPHRAIALGHSLGATRALHATEGETAGYVLLAGAYLSPTRDSPSKSAAEALAAFGEAGQDGSISPDEVAAVGVQLPARFETIDRDHSGALCGWELAAAERLPRKDAPKSERFDREGRLSWPSDVLVESKGPVLAIWGGLDATSMHGPVLEQIAQHEGIELQSRYFEGLGHNLGRVEGDRTGPINSQVVKLVLEWLETTIAQQGPDN